MDEQDRKAIVNLTVKLIAGLIEKGELNPDDDEALKKATKECAALARSAYFAALEFIS